MTRYGLLLISILVLIGIASSAVVLFRHPDTPQALPSVEATSTPATDPSSFSIYTSGEYGFLFFYPENATLTDAFSASTTNNAAWRVNAVATGTPIVRLTASSGEVHVGVSSNKNEVSDCIKANPAEAANGTTMLGSTTWNVFTFKKVGTDNESLVTSYRTRKNSNCFALETIVPTNKGASSTELSTIVHSFTFVK